MSVIHPRLPHARSVVLPQYSDHSDPESCRVLAALHLARQKGILRDVAAAERSVVLHYLPMASAVARHFQGRIEHDDLVQVARVGLVKAVRGWRPQPAGGFLQYGTAMVTGEIRRYLRDHSAAVRVPRRIYELGPTIATARADLTSGRGRVPTDREVAAAAGLPVDAVRQDRLAQVRRNPTSLDQKLDQNDGETAPSDWANEQLDAVEDRDMLRYSLSRLTEREQRLIGLRFFQDQTQDQIGKVLGVSQMQVSRMLRSTLGRMRAFAME
jgi:RNA polymerase sigma-B factor